MEEMPDKRSVVPGIPERNGAVHSRETTTAPQGKLKGKVARGVAWGIAEKVGTALLQMGVSLVVLRHLVPDETGAWGIMTAVVAVALILVDSGFSQTLIRKPDPSEADYRSVFALNLAIAVVLYLLLTIAAPFVGRFYAMPLVGTMGPVLFLLLPVSALCTIQNTIFARQMRFALMSKVVFVASAVSGVVAVGLAVSGFGLWSFVGQRVAAMAVRTGLLWWLSDWRPRGRFDGSVLCRMAPFSLSLMTTDLISTLYTKIPQFFIGRLYPASVLGFFDQAVKIKDLPLTSAMQSVQGVTYPALSKIGGDDAKFAESYRQLAMVTAFALFPAMAGLIAVADELFPVLIGEQWLPTVPYFRAVCLTGFFYPIAILAYNVLKVKSDGRIIVRLEVVKKIIMTVVFALTIFRSVMAVVWGLVAMSFLEMCLNVGAARRYTTLSVGRLFRTLLPVALATAGMYGAVWTVGRMIGSPLLRLFVEMGVGAAVYIVLSALFRLEAFLEVSGMVRREFLKKE